MSLKHGLLGLLNYGPMTGYELDKAFSVSLDFFWQAKTSQVYRELDAMEHSGWLTSERVIQNEKPNKRVYSLTASGKEELINWLSEPEADIMDTMRVRSAFLMRVFFAGEIDDGQALLMMRRYRQTCAEMLAALDMVSDSVNQYEQVVADERKTKYWKITELYSEAYYQAGLAWADKAIAIMEGE